MKNSKWSVQKLVFTGMLAALAGVLMSLEFSIPMMPPFYKIDFSDVPSIIALFTFGPVSAACVEFIKILIKLITVGTNTMYVGEFANLIGIVLFVLPIWLIYSKRGKTTRAMIESLVFSVPIRIAFSCCINAFITLPLYAKAMGITVDEVVVAVASVNPSIHDLATFLVLATVPFNLIKLTLNSLVAALLYKQLLEARVLPKLAARAN